MKILFVSPIIPNYRVWLYTKLNELKGKDFLAIHGKEEEGAYPKDIGKSSLFNNILAHNFYLKLKDVPICFQMNIGEVIKFDPDVLILLDNVKILSNWFLFILSYVLKYKIIYFTHGMNNWEFSSKTGILAKFTETIRSFFLKNCAALIAYTPKVKDYLVTNNKITPSKVFVASNTLDIEMIRKDFEKINNDDIYRLKKQLNIKDKFTICFLGRLTPQKNLKLWIDVMKELQKSFEVCGIIIGDGPQLKWCIEYINDREIKDIHLVGEKYGQELATFLKVSNLMFLPQHAGLAIVHSFIAGLPFITGAADNHGPEIEYLIDDYNGVLVKDLSTDNFANEIKSLIQDRDKLKRYSIAALETIKNNCNSSNMIKSFLDAIDFSIQEK